MLHLVDLPVIVFFVSLLRILAFRVDVEHSSIVLFFRLILLGVVVFLHVLSSSRLIKLTAIKARLNCLRMYLQPMRL